MYNGLGVSRVGLFLWLGGYWRVWPLKLSSDDKMGERLNPLGFIYFLLCIISVGFRRLKLSSQAKHSLYILCRIWSPSSFLRYISTRILIWNCRVWPAQEEGIRKLKFWFS